NRWQSGIERQSHPQLFRAGRPTGRSTARMDAVVTETEFVQQRWTDRSRPRQGCILRAYARLITAAAVREKVPIVVNSIVIEMINEVTSGQSVFRSQLMIDLRYDLIEILADIAAEHDPAVTANVGNVLQYIDGDRVKPACRNLVVRKRLACER